MIGKCTGCGDCCAVVTVSKPLWERITSLQMEGQHTADEAFVLENWHPMAPEDAANIAPYDGSQMWVDFWTESQKTNAVLKCDAFDYTTRQCTKYDTRPGVCRGFPWYDGKAPHKEPLWRLFRCGYWADIPREEWPDWVDVVELARQGLA